MDKESLEHGDSELTFRVISMRSWKFYTPIHDLEGSIKPAFIISISSSSSSQSDKTLGTPMMAPDRLEPIQSSCSGVFNQYGSFVEDSNSCGSIPYPYDGKITALMEPANKKNKGPQEQLSGLALDASQPPVQKKPKL